MFSCKFAAFFSEHLFLGTALGGCFCIKVGKEQSFSRYFAANFIFLRYVQKMQLILVRLRSLNFDHLFEEQYSILSNKKSILKYIEALFHVTTIAAIHAIYE